MFRFFVLLLFFPCFLWGQELTIEDIQAMHKVGTSKEEILQAVQEVGLKKSRGMYLKLRKLGYSATFISKLMSPRARFPELPDELKKLYNKNTENPGIWALVVGIDSYKNLPALQYAVADAKSFAGYLLSIGVPPQQICLLQEKQVSPKQIRQMFAQLIKTKEKVYFFYSGHGLYSNNSGFYFSCYNTEKDSLESLVQSSYSMHELKESLNKMQGKSATIFVDACHSGGKDADIDFGDDEPENKIQINKASENVHLKMKNLKESNKSVAIITSCRANQISQEAGGNGLFTKVLLEALTGKADENENGWIDADEIYDYVHRYVRKKSKRKQEPDSSFSDHWNDKGLPVGKTKITIVKKLKIKRIKIYPQTASCKPGKKISFSATGYGENEQKIPAKFIWQAKYGKISSSGVYKAPQGRKKDVILATLPGNKKIKKAVTVTIKPANDFFEEKTAKRVLTRLEISPNQVKLKIRESVRFRVIGYDSSGQEMKTNYLSWSAPGGNIYNKNYTAGNAPGKYRINVKSSGVSAWAYVEIVPKK